MMEDMAPSPARLLLFHRHFLGLTGGHLKVWQYFCHAGQSQRYEPRIYLTPQSLRDASNPWHGIAPAPLQHWHPEDAAVLFLAGLDWEAVPDPAPAPVINLIQGLRHGDSGDRRRPFLSRPALRICVSQEVAAAIEATGEVNGPVHVIPNGLDRDELAAAQQQRAPLEPNRALLIAGRKNPALALALAERLQQVGIEAQCLLEPLPRARFLEQVAGAAVVVTLPQEREGFFLPALEAMALGAVVVCPDCVGNRSFCLDGQTAFRPAYGLEAILAATIAALQQPAQAAAAMRQAAAAMVDRHSLEVERAAFLRILDSLEG